ncbi:MAG: efflux RND transporter periplasmic adaptor subunit [Gemmatimonadota bacterium]
MSRITAVSLPSPRTVAQFAPYLTTLAVLTLLTLGGCSSGSDAQAATPSEASVPVRVSTLAGHGSSGAGAIRVTGTLAGKEEVSLAFKIGGVIQRIEVDPGQPVRAGQVLAALRPTEISAQLANAQEARGKAERDLTRVARLYADSVATLEQLQDARTALDVATNGVRIAQFNADYASIRAPGDGVVLTRSAEAGQVVEAGRSVLLVRRHGRGMVVRVGLPDRDAVRVRLGDTAKVRFEAMPGRTFTARVTQRAAAASSSTGDYGIELSLLDADHSLPSGLVAQVALHPSASPASAQHRVQVPLDALVDADADSAAVFVLRADGASVSRRTVRLADVAEALQTARVAVLAGLDGSETVVTAGQARLVDGTRVRVIAPTARQAVADATTPRWTPAR